MLFLIGWVLDLSFADDCLRLLVWLEVKSSVQSIQEVAWLWTLLTELHRQILLLRSLWRQGCAFNPIQEAGSNTDFTGSRNRLLCMFLKICCSLSSFWPYKHFISILLYFYLPSILWWLWVQNKNLLFSLRMDDACVLACNMQPTGVLGGKQSRGAQAVQQNCDSWVWDDAVTSLRLSCAWNLSPLAFHL